MIGTFGGIIFETSDERVLSLAALQTTAGSSWAVHEVHGAKPRAEYLSPRLRTAVFDLKLVATLGVRPRQLLEQLSSLAEGRLAFPLVIGDKPISDHPMRLISVSNVWNQVFRGGELFAATVSVEMEEYV